MAAYGESFVAWHVYCQMGVSTARETLQLREGIHRHNSMPTLIGELAVRQQKQKERKEQSMNNVGMAPQH
eukprot:scaffold3792_cov160-Skeletonema_menzelii.AAC.18